MKIFFKTLFFLSIGSFLFLLLILNAKAQVIDNAPAKQIESLKLKTGQLLDSATISPTNVDAKTGKISKLPSEVDYSYIGNVVNNASGILFDGSNYSNAEKINDHQIKYYSRTTFVKDTDNFVKVIEYATTTPEIWQSANVQTIGDKILSLLKTPYVNADSYYATGDNSIYSYTTSYSQLLADYQKTLAGTGDGVALRNGTTNEVDNQYWSNTYWVERGFFNFSGITNLSNINTIDFYVYKTSGVNNSKYYNIFGSYGSSPTVVGDFTKVYSTALATHILDSSFTASGYTDFSINSTGVSAFKNGSTTLSFRADDDVNQVKPTVEQNLWYADSTYSGTDHDPYLLITYNATTTPPVATTTPLNCIWPNNTDIGVIVGCVVTYAPTTSTSTMSTTSLQMLYYNVPAILYFYIFSVFSACLAIYFIFKK